MPRLSVVIVLLAIAVLAAGCGTLLSDQPASPTAVIAETASPVPTNVVTSLTPTPTPLPTPPPPRYVERCFRSACDLVTRAEAYTYPPPIPFRRDLMLQGSISRDYSVMANLERTGSRVLAIVISDLRTGVRRQVANVGSLHDNEAPVWSPNGTMFAFQNPHGEGELPIPITIDVATADGSRVWTVSDGLESAFSPSWSPDGSQLVFTSGGALFIVNADGSGRG